MLRKSIDSSAYAVRNVGDKLLTNGPVNEETMKEAMESIQAGDDRWKMTSDWRQEDLQVRRNEERILQDFSSFFKSVNGEEIAQIEAKIDELNKSSNVKRFRELVHEMKKKYDIDVPSILGAYDRRNEKLRRRLARSEKTIQEEWDRFLQYEAKRVAMKQLIEDEELLDNEEFDARASEQKAHRHRIAYLMDRVLKKQKQCRLALQLVSELASSEHKNKKLVEKMTDDAYQSRETLIKMLDFAEEGLDKLMSIRQTNYEQKKARRYVDEQCNVCQTNEKAWEDEKLKTTYLLEPMTAKDAREFHTRLVRSGEMKALVDHFKNIIEDDVDPDVALPTFIAGFGHPEQTQELYKEIRDYNCLKLMKENISSRERNLVDKNKKNLVDVDECGYGKFCYFCGTRKWYFIELINILLLRRNSL